MGDIETRADVEALVRAFYERAMADEVIGWLFVDVAKLDLEAHLPRITDFWETVLLGGGVLSRRRLPPARGAARQGRAARRALRPLARAVERRRSTSASPARAPSRPRRTPSARPPASAAA